MVVADDVLHSVEKLYRDAKPFHSYEALPFKLTLNDYVPVALAVTSVALFWLLLRTLDYGVVDRPLSAFLAAGSTGYTLSFAALTLFFTTFLAALRVDPRSIEADLSKAGAHVLGDDQSGNLRSEESMVRYFDGLILKQCLSSSVVLTMIATLPFVVQRISGARLGLGGASLIIVVFVTLRIRDHITDSRSLRELDAVAVP